MTTIINPNSLTTAYSFTTSTSDSDTDFEDTITNACLTATSLSTTLQMTQNERIYAEETQRYVDSLSDDELYRFEQMLSDKELEMIEKSNEYIEKQKVKIQ